MTINKFIVMRLSNFFRSFKFWPTIYIGTLCVCVCVMITIHYTNIYKLNYFHFLNKSLLFFYIKNFRLKLDIRLNNLKISYGHNATLKWEGDQNEF